MFPNDQTILRSKIAKFMVYFGQHNFVTHNQRQATLVVPKLTWVNYGYIHDMHINIYIYICYVISWSTMDILWLSCSTGAIAKDDTTVRGTEEVHYPAHVESVRVLRPELEPVSLEGHLEKKNLLILSDFLNDVSMFLWHVEFCRK